MNITITPAEHVDQVREMRVMFAELVSQLGRREANVAAAIGDVRHGLEDVERGWGAGNVSDHAARLGREEEARQAAYEGLKVAIRATAAIYGRDAVVTILREVGAEKLSDKNVATYLAKEAA